MTPEYIWILVIVVATLIARHGLNVYKAVETTKAEIDKEFKLDRAKLYANRDINVAKVEAGAEIELNSLGSDNSTSQSGEFNINSIMELLSNPSIKPMLEKFLAKKE